MPFITDSEAKTLEAITKSAGPRREVSRRVGMIAIVFVSQTFLLTTALLIRSDSICQEFYIWPSLIVTIIVVASKWTERVKTKRAVNSQLSTDNSQLKQ